MPENAIGGRIRAARERAKMGQAELARAMGVGGQWIWKIENGHATPSLDLLKRIASELNVSLDSLVYDEQAAS